MSPKIIVLATRVFWIVVCQPLSWQYQDLLAAHLICDLCFNKNQELMSREAAPTEVRRTLTLPPALSSSAGVVQAQTRRSMPASTSSSTAGVVQTETRAPTSRIVLPSPRPYRASRVEEVPTVYEREKPTTVVVNSLPRVGLALQDSEELTRPLIESVAEEMSNEMYILRKGKKQRAITENSTKRKEEKVAPEHSHTNSRRGKEREREHDRKDRDKGKVKEPKDIVLTVSNLGEKIGCAIRLMMFDSIDFDSQDTKKHMTTHEEVVDIAVSDTVLSVRQEILRLWFNSPFLLYSVCKLKCSLEYEHNYGGRKGVKFRTLIPGGPLDEAFKGLSFGQTLLKHIDHTVLKVYISKARKLPLVVKMTPTAEQPFHIFFFRVATGKIDAKLRQTEPPKKKFQAAKRKQEKKEERAEDDEEDEEENTIDLTAGYSSPSEEKIMGVYSQAVDFCPY